MQGIISEWLLLLEELESSVESSALLVCSPGCSKGCMAGGGVSGSCGMAEVEGRQEGHVQVARPQHLPTLRLQQRKQLQPPPQLRTRHADIAAG